MGLLESKWNKTTNKGLKQKLSEKGQNGVTGGSTPLKPRINKAKNNLQVQVEKLDKISKSLQQKQNKMLQMVVSAKRNNNDSYARAYAAELAEIRKMNNLVDNSKMALTQVQLRLDTITDLGDVVVTLSPCMSVVKGLGVGLKGVIPEANASMNDLSDILGDIVSDARMESQDQFNVDTGVNNPDTAAILDEAESTLETKLRSDLPSPPKQAPSSVYGTDSSQETKMYSGVENRGTPKDAEFRRKKTKETT